SLDQAHRLGPTVRIDVGDNDLGAFPGEELCRGTTDAGAGTRDECDPSVHRCHTSGTVAGEARAGPRCNDSPMSGTLTAPDQNWYAVALAEEIDDGKILGADLFNGRVAVYRRADGTPVVLSAVCPHMGADLALGDVIGDDIRCTFHHFCFVPDGTCTAIPSDDNIPSKARVTSFPTAERWGLIWAFNGAEPLFDAPGIRDYDDASLAVRARRTDMFPVEPWVIMGNSFDFTHLRYVHRLVFDDPEDIR